MDCKRSTHADLRYSSRAKDISNAGLPLDMGLEPPILCIFAFSIDAVPALVIGTL